MKKVLTLVLTISVILFHCMETLAKQEENKNQYRKTELVELVKLDPKLKLDIRYATKNNFLGRPVYIQAKAFLHKPVAEDLIKVNKSLNEKDLGLLIFDGYRPWSVTKIFWDEIDPDKRQFVADPKIGSIHNRGCAVDLTLYEIKTEKLVKMPSDYDEFTERAFPSYKGGTIEERKNRDLLITEMKKHNFTVHSNEWWHYDHKDCDKYEVLDLSFEEITSESLSKNDKLERR